MSAREILESDDWKKCAEFHGHVCPGLAMGYKAAQAAMRKLAENRSEDEEVVAILETDSCVADAVQVLTGCTFGKGNFFHRDHGKTVLTLLSRRTGDGVRVAVKADAFKLGKEHRELLDKVSKREAAPDEKETFQRLHEDKTIEILERPDQDIFTIREVQKSLPRRAVVEPSQPCGICGEPTMASRLIDSGDLKVCRDCTGAT